MTRADERSSRKGQGSRPSQQDLLVAAACPVSTDRKNVLRQRSAAMRVLHSDGRLTTQTEKDLDRSDYARGDVEELKTLGGVTHAERVCIYLISALWVLTRQFTK